MNKRQSRSRRSTTDGKTGQESGLLTLRCRTNYYSLFLLHQSSLLRLAQGLSLTSISYSKVSWRWSSVAQIRHIKHIELLPIVATQALTSKSNFTSFLGCVSQRRGKSNDGIPSYRESEYDFSRTFQPPASFNHQCLNYYSALQYQEWSRARLRTYCFG